MTFKLRERETGLLCDCGKEECECVTFKLINKREKYFLKLCNKYPELSWLIQSMESDIEEQDKEFIRLLKEGLTGSYPDDIKKIDNLSGFSDDEDEKRVRRFKW